MPAPTADVPTTIPFDLERHAARSSLPSPRPRSRTSGSPPDPPLPLRAPTPASHRAHEHAGDPVGDAAGGGGRFRVASPTAGCFRALAKARHCPRSSRRDRPGQFGRQTLMASLAAAEDGSLGTAASMARPWVRSPPGANRVRREP